MCLPSCGPLIPWTPASAVLGPVPVGAAKAAVKMLGYTTMCMYNKKEKNANAGTSRKAVPLWSTRWCVGVVRVWRGRGALTRLSMQ
jgi:hypothetical protein